jgi:DNA-binding SARP family transcriptional activator
VTGTATHRAARIDVLGRFGVVVDGRAVDETVWPGRRSAELVQLLALSPRHQLLRDEVLDALWPHLPPEAAGNNLRKAAHHARQVLGDADAVVLRAGTVALFPDREVVTDLGVFEAAAAGALAASDPSACAAVASTWGGDVLPGARYEDWAEPHRRRARARQLELL